MPTAAVDRSSTTIDRLHRRYARQRDAATRAALIEHYLPWVRQVARLDERVAVLQRILRLYEQHQERHAVPTR